MNRLPIYCAGSLISFGPSGLASRKTAYRSIRELQQTAQLSGLQSQDLSPKSPELSGGGEDKSHLQRKIRFCWESQSNLAHIVLRLRIMISASSACRFKLKAPQPFGASTAACHVFFLSSCSGLRVSWSIIYSEDPIDLIC